VNNMEYVKFSKFIVSTQYGYTAEETSLVKGDAKYLRITDIVPYFVNKEQVPFCKIDDNKKKKYLINENDLLIARTGATTGYNLVVDESYKNFVFASYLIRFNYNKNDLYPLYLKYVLKSQQWYGFVNNFISGSAQPGMNAKAFGKFQIPFFNYDIQKRISNILSTYDKLIDNNNKRIKLLEQMAENLYKEWFVRFRFPGYEDVEFIDGFPKEWKICRIDQLSKIKAGGDAPDDSTKEITDECSIPIYSNGIENEGLYGYTSKAKISKPSITISARGTVGYTCLRRVSYTPIVRLICVIPHEEKLVNWLFYYFKRTIVIANGTSQQQITIPMMSREKVLLPTNDLIQKFYEYSTCYLDEIDSLKAQNSNLEKQRDMLLPRLMSGKLEV
jgi:type I restriction modification DNA specificity domain protein